MGFGGDLGTESHGGFWTWDYKWLCWSKTMCSEFQMSKMRNCRNGKEKQRRVKENGRTEDGDHVPTT